LKKSLTTFSCQQCGTQYAKWQGKCTTCQAWNTIVETIPAPQQPAARWHTTHIPLTADSKQPKLLQHIDLDTQDKIVCPDAEFSRVLGGGIVPGSLVLIGGEPGIGKSTLLLQLALTLPLESILYVSGEESEAQIKMRAMRMNFQSESVYLLNETSLQHVFQQIQQLQPRLLIIDSIQTLHTQHLDAAAGSVAQVRDCTTALLHYAKSTHTPVLLVGHITKDGNLAGPKVLEHMVDTVLQFEGDRHLSYRIVRTIKNRFGATSELGIYEMHHHGLREVANPSELLIAQRVPSLPGTAIGASLEGNRALLIELQTLVSPTHYGNAQRSATGFDIKRLNMLLAVLEKRVGLRLSAKDVFLNIAGGLRVADPGLDLAVCVALISSLHDQPSPPDCCFSAEVGLGGEMRAVNRVEQRISEAAKLGFETIFIAHHNAKSISDQDFEIDIKFVHNIQEMLKLLL
jgi:DNA repair protein RadA/Sms